MKVKQDYLPKERLDKYLNVNPSSSLSSLVPRGMTEDELTMELTDKFTSVSYWFFARVLKTKMSQSLFNHLNITFNLQGKVDISDVLAAKEKAFSLSVT